jgi:NMD protein affecting ribosome stability and mRNA decay
MGTLVCAHCGAYQDWDGWAQDPETGEQGLKSIEYREADEASQAWMGGRDG